MQCIVEIHAPPHPCTQEAEAGFQASLSFTWEVEDSLEYTTYSHGKDHLGALRAVDTGMKAVCHWRRVEDEWRQVSSVHHTGPALG